MVKTINMMTICRLYYAGCIGELSIIKSLLHPPEMLSLRGIFCGNIGDYLRFTLDNLPFTI